MAENSDTESTTFTYRQATREWLEQSYPDAIGINEALRNAIADARLVRNTDYRVVEAREESDE